jgi:hypothetical protein
VAIMRRVCEEIQLPPQEAYLLRSIAGHMVVGTDQEEERKQFQDLFQKLEKSAG